MSIVLVTGTGTDIGKTIGTAALAAALRGEGRQVHVVKPIQTGFPDPDGGDLDTVAELTGIDNLHGFERYPEPMAPVAAAQRAGMRLPNATEIAEKIKLIDGPNRVVLVEGAGGLLVRLGEDWALPELAALLPGSQMVVVTRLGLGCLNEAELTVEVARGAWGQCHGAGGRFAAGGCRPDHRDEPGRTATHHRGAAAGVGAGGSGRVGAAGVCGESYAVAAGRARVGRSAVGEPQRFKGRSGGASK